ncbi:hypothetical protein WKR98_13245 [Pigmentiphaga sp. YJ18]|uniref:hypothetical protein n=1 Tax=Pigmentiphaga sp. YJ18 TaxID=3134907 RepID=UPI003110B755
MALMKTVSTAQGFEALDAYHRVEAPAMEGKDLMQFTLRSYVRREGLPFFAEKYFRCPFDLGGSNPYQQAYAYLKSLPEFSGAADC